MTELTPKQVEYALSNRQTRPPAKKLGEAVNDLMKRRIIPRHHRLGRLTLTWQELLPAELVEHTCLERLNRGQLTILVDSAAHLAELTLLIKEGLVEEMRQMCPSIALADVKLRRGQWYSTDEDGTRIMQFQRPRRIKERRGADNQP